MRDKHVTPARHGMATFGVTLSKLTPPLRDRIIHLNDSDMQRLVHRLSITAELRHQTSAVIEVQGPLLGTHMAEISSSTVLILTMTEYELLDLTNGKMVTGGGFSLLPPHMKGPHAPR